MKKIVKILVPVVGAVVAGMYLKHKYFSDEEGCTCKCSHCGCKDSKHCNCHTGCSHHCKSEHDPVSLIQIKQRLEEKLEAIKEKLNNAV